MRLGRVLDFTDARAVAAAHIVARHKLAMADAAMYAIALEFGASFWTQDADYQGLAGVRYQPKPGA
jgi:predicted nucleic acid-binding protein